MARIGVEDKMVRTVLLKKRRGSAQLIQYALAVMIIVAIGGVVVALIVGFTSPILQYVPQPPQGTLFYNMTQSFNKAVNQGMNLLPAVFLMGFGVMILGAVMYIWGWFSPRPLA
jgi:hypothetical protein